jgi:Domain of unknown function (DUF4249)
MKFICPIVFLMLLLISCNRTEIEETPWNKTTLPAVIGILNANDTISIYLTQTYESGTSTHKVAYPEARVYISVQDSAWKELKRNEADSSIYIDTTQNNITIAGKKYKLRIELKDKTVSSETTIPNVFVKITDAFFITKDTNVNYPNGITTYKYTLPKGNYKYVGTSVYEPYSDSFYSGMITFNDSVQTDETYYGSTRDSATVTAVFQTLNPDLYEFRKAVNLNSYNTFIGSDGSAIVIAAVARFGGVMPMFSNITNGVGIFSGSCTSKRKVRWEK